MKELEEFTKKILFSNKFTIFEDPDLEGLLLINKLDLIKFLLSYKLLF